MLTRFKLLIKLYVKENLSLQRKYLEYELVNWSGKKEDIGANISNQLSVISFIWTIFKRQR